MLETAYSGLHHNQGSGHPTSDSQNHSTNSHMFSSHWILLHICCCEMHHIKLSNYPKRLTRLLWTIWTLPIVPIKSHLVIDGILQINLICFCLIWFTNYLGTKCKETFRLSSCSYKFNKILSLEDRNHWQGLELCIACTCTYWGGQKSVFFRADLG